MAIGGKCLGWFCHGLRRDPSGVFLKRRLLVAAGLAVLLGGLYVYISSPPGYCRAQKRYIPDEEFLKASIALLYWDMNRLVTYPDRSKKKQKDVLNVYKNIDFDPANPNCCSVYRNPEPSVFERTLGCQEVAVRLNPTTSKRPVRIMGDGFIGFNYSVCGELLDSSIGLPDTSAKTFTTTNYLDITSKR